MAVLGYLAKLKRGLGLASGAHFLHDLSALCVLAHPEVSQVNMAHLVEFM